MTDRPILFSAPMVRAILREIEAPGTGKTQTRRILKLAGRRPDYIGPRGCTDDPACWGWEQPDGGFILADRDPEDARAVTWHDFEASPRSGDRLWVRETWCEYAKGEAWYRADHGQSAFVWRPSIHMPRWASRLTLTVTDVRVQRLHDISEDDARAEGVARCEWIGDRVEFYIDGATNLHPTPRGPFMELWDDLNAKRGFGWDSNPWVAAITFTPRLGNIDSEGTR